MSVYLSKAVPPFRLKHWLKWCLTSTVSIFNVYMVTVCCRCLNKLPATQIITLHQSEMSSQLISSWVAVFLWALCTLHTLFWAAVKQGSSKCISIFSMNPPSNFIFTNMLRWQLHIILFKGSTTEHRFSLQVEIKLQSYVGCKTPVHSSKQSINMVKLDSDKGFSSKRLDDGKATESNE